MKICFLAPANNYHTRKWCEWFKNRGHEVHVVSFTEGSIEYANIHYINTGAIADESDIKKIKYLFSAPKVKKIVRDIEPDIVNVHYASSYGTVAALAGIKGHIVSVWGSDVYDFPQKSVLHRLVLKFSLSKARLIFSTSEAMAKETKKYTKRNIEITPFGVDMDLFNPNKRNRLETDFRFVVGTVKALTPKYGIDVLLRSVARLRKEGIPIFLEIAGRGEKEQEYKELAKALHISEICKWYGFVPQEKVAEIWANIDLAIIPSMLESESFGVSAVEAEASGTAVVISDIPGLMEATSVGNSSIVFHRGSDEELAHIIRELYFDKKCREGMARAGRQYVEKKYDINRCFKRVEGIYMTFIRNRKK